MTISIKALAVTGLAGLILAGCGYPLSLERPAPQQVKAVAPVPVQTQAATAPAAANEEVEEEQVPRLLRPSGFGHVPSGPSHNFDDGDEDGGWG